MTWNLTVRHDEDLPLYAVHDTDTHCDICFFTYRDAASKIEAHKKADIIASAPRMYEEMCRLHALVEKIIGDMT